MYSVSTSGAWGAPGSSSAQVQIQDLPRGAQIQRSEVADLVKQAICSQGPGPAGGPWKLFGLSMLKYMHSPTL